MRLLLDTCVWGGVRVELEASGHEVIWAGQWSVDPGDEEILAHAFAERRVLVTLDKDFGELAIVRRFPHCGIVRLVNFSARRQGAICLQVLARHGDDLISGAIVTADPRVIRIRPPDVQDDSGDESPA